MKDRRTGQYRRLSVALLSLSLFIPIPGHAQSTVVVATVRDTTGAPVLPCRIEVVGSHISAVGDSQGRVVLRGIPPGRHGLRVRGIGFFVRVVAIEARGDTLWLPPVVLRHNPIFDSLTIVPNRHGTD